MLFCSKVPLSLQDPRPNLEGGRLENRPALEISFLGCWKLKTIVNLKTECFRYASMHNGRMSRGCEKNASSSSPQKATALPKLSLPKKDKLKKKEWAVAEKHLLNFGESIQQKEQWLDVHKYQAHSSYFPSQIESLLLDQLLIIHFPSQNYIPWQPQCAARRRSPSERKLASRSQTGRTVEPSIHMSLCEGTLPRSGRHDKNNSAAVTSFTLRGWATELR